MPTPSHGADSGAGTASRRVAPPAPGGHRGNPVHAWVAAVTGAVGLLLAIIVPMLPVTQTTTELSWPQQGSLDSVTAPLVAYYPHEMSAVVPCEAVDQLLEQGSENGMLVGTAPNEAGERAGARGMTVSIVGDSVEVRSRNHLIASAPVDDVTSQQCEAIRITSDAYETSAEFEGIGISGSVEEDVRGQVVGVFSDLTGEAPQGMDVSITVDSRYTTSPTLLKQIAVVMGIILTMVSLYMLHRLDLRDGRLPRRVLPRRWWKPRPLDLLVIGILVVWHVIGANTSDDGYILTQARSIPASGYVPEVFRYYGAPYAPFGMPFYLITILSEYTVASFWLRIPTLIAAIIAWLLISREVIPRLGNAARNSPAARWTAAAVFLAFWLTYNNGLRPEPIIAVGVLATWVSLERALATGRLLPAAVGFIIGGFTLSAAPTGSFCIAVIIAASRPLLLLIIRRARRDGWVATLAPLLAAGTLVLHWIFIDQPLVTTLQSSALLGEVGPMGEWYEESWRYSWLMDPTPDGALARRFAVFAMFLSLITCAAVVFRKGRIPGVAVGPTYRILGLSVLSIALMMFNPTKWTHHFGAFASIGALLAALVAMAVLPAATRSLRNRTLFVAAVFFVLAISFESTNGWWYISIYGIPWGDTSPEIGGVKIASVFVAACLVSLAAALFLHYRAPFVAARPPRRRGDGPVRRTALEAWHAPLGVAAGLVVLFVIASMTIAVRNQYPAYSVGLQNLRNLQGQECGIADAVLAEDDTNAGLLSPLGVDGPESPGYANQLSGGDDPDVFTPGGLAGDLTPTKTVAESEDETDEAGRGLQSPGQSSAVDGVDDANGATETGATGTTDDTGTTDASGVDAGQTATTDDVGVNGSHVELPFGLDPALVPVLGSYQVGPQQLNAHTTSLWYPLPEDRDGSPLITVAVAGNFEDDAVRIEWSEDDDPAADAEATGSLELLDPGPSPRWRNLRLPMDEVPDEASAIRLVANDTDPAPNRWVAVTPPRVPELQTLQELVGDTRPVLPDWAVAFHVPCMRPFEERAGIHELPDYRIMPDRGLATSSTNTWQGWDGGGPLGFIDLLQEGVTVPTYLEHDWDRDWGALIEYSPLVEEATEAELDHGEVVRSGLWNGGPLAR